MNNTFWRLLHIVSWMKIFVPSHSVLRKVYPLKADDGPWYPHFCNSPFLPILYVNLHLNLEEQLRSLSTRIHSSLKKILYQPYWKQGGRCWGSLLKKKKKSFFNRKWNAERPGKEAPQFYEDSKMFRGHVS